ncbi:SGNH/GDSL hydrolase family protein [Hoyosella sp. G463]|uniref:SGNH/GDSL hydrolase family protein n=1 Tax=Lolliginicoccus lacisalsi TaxID=2742202 RepID=A0A927JAR2_9ACTN|nr:diglucosylglycerate octanoyltransferase [Lolliginicoccus lacisalsi]MBD8505651.1 SGNH/GDSL hydrolase family protein [Lolliginicoccus lacisalsi]
MLPEPSTTPTLLVLGDSLAFYGPSGGLPADDHRIWPSLVAAELGWRTHLCARVGWTSRDAWWALTQDPLVWSAIPRAGAVVIAVAGMDSLPSPLPTALREQIRYVRPSWLRRRVRATYARVQPVLAPLGWPMALPPAVTVAYLERIRGAIDAVRPDIPILAVLPAQHHSRYYGYTQPGQPRTSRAITQWASEKGVPLIDIPAATIDHLRAHEGNPDGIHWGFAAHRRVARLMHTAIVSGESDSPGSARAAR